MTARGIHIRDLIGEINEKRTEIENLRAELAAAQKQNELQEKHIATVEHDGLVWIKRYAALEEQNKQLREALGIALSSMDSAKSIEPLKIARGIARKTLMELTK